MILAAAIILTLAMLVVIYLDATCYRIPNWLNLGLLVAFPLWAVVAPQMDWLAALYLFLALFAAGYLMFAFGIMGGGDVKLLAVCGLYVGWGQSALAFIFYVSLLGGVLALALIILRLMVPPLYRKLGFRTIPAVLTMGEPIPYGLAIAGAFLWMIWNNQLPGMMVG